MHKQMNEKCLKKLCFTREKRDEKWTDQNNKHAREGKKAIESKSNQSSLLLLL